MALPTMKLANRRNMYTSVLIVFDNRENCKQCQPSLNGLVFTGVTLQFPQSKLVQGSTWKSNHVESPLSGVTIAKSMVIGPRNVKLQQDVPIKQGYILTASAEKRTTGNYSV